MSLSSGDWLYSELERASEEFRSLPEWSRPVVTVPRPAPSEGSQVKTGFQVPTSDDGS